MSEKNEINEEKLTEIIKYSNNEISKRSEGVSKETIVSHIAEKIKEVVKDDIRED